MILQKLFPRLHSSFQSTDKKTIRGSVSLGALVASCGIVGLYIDHIDNEVSVIVCGLVIVLVGGITVILNQAEWAKPAFEDYCDWRKSFHYFLTISPILLLVFWGLLIFIPKFLQNYCIAKENKK